MEMWCLGRKPKLHKAVQTNISYVHLMRLVEYDTNINEGSRVVQREPRKGGESSGPRPEEKKTVAVFFFLAEGTIGTIAFKQSDISS